MAQVTQPALANFKGIISVAGYATPGFQHVIVATKDGDIHEVFFGPDGVPHVTQPALANFEGIVSISAYSTPGTGVGTQHVMVATANGDVHEVFF